MNIDERITQGEFAELVGTSQPTISRMLRDELLPRGGSLRAWMGAYIAAIESERDALLGSGDDSAEARAARLALTTATTRLRSQQTEMLVRQYKADVKAFTDRMLGEVRALLFLQLPAAVVGRLLSVIPAQEDRYAAAKVFRDLLADAVDRVLRSQVDDSGCLHEAAEQTAEGVLDDV